MEMMMLKEDLYRELKSNEGSVMSGQQLADLYRVSRTAVWKAVRSLQEEGYPIESVGRKGYRIAKGTDLLTTDGIRAFLTQPDRIEIRVFRTIDSTNGEAERMIADGFRGPALLAAEEQTRGRGHNRSTFESPAAKGVYMTLLLPLRLPFTEVSFISRAAADAVTGTLSGICRQNLGNAETAAQQSHEIHTEKINDIYDGDRKIGGILCEVLASDLESGCIDVAVIGIGIHLDGLPAGVTRDRITASITSRLYRSLYDRSENPDV